jgi:hypothetical protein
VLALVRRPTPGDVSGTEDAIADCVAELAERYDVVAVGIGAAGWIANDRATVLFSPHLAWRDEPLKEALVDRIGLPVTVENDANAAAWAEYRFGAAGASGWSASSRSAPGSAAAWSCPARSTAARSGWPGSGATCRWCRTAGAAPAATGVAGRCTRPAPRWPGTPASWPRSRRWPRTGCWSWPAATRPR